MDCTAAKLRPLRTAVTTPLSSETGEPVTPAGRVFLNPSFNLHILVTLGSKFPINVDSLKAGLHDTILKHRRFCSIVREDNNGQLYWMPTDVNLDDHIIIVEASDVDQSSPTFVEDYAAKLAQGPPLDPSRPLFELHIVKARLGDAEENLVVKMHHALGDGTSLMSLLLACTRKVDQPDSLPTLPARVIRNRNKMKIFEALFVYSWSFLLVIWLTFCDICSLLSTMFWLKDSQTPLKGYAGIERLPRKFAHRTFPLDDIRLVKEAIHGTVNDVVFGMVAAGVSYYLQQQSATDDESEHLDKLATWKYMWPRKKRLASLRVRACALVNTRKSPGLHELESMMCGGSQARWGNKMGYIILPVPLLTGGNPLNHVYKAKSIIDKKKLSLGASFSYASGRMLMSLFGSQLPSRLTYNCTFHTTLAFSNVFGPLEEVQLFGHPVTHIIPTVTGQPQALCVHAQTYMGKATIVVSTAKDIIPDPDRLCQYMACALEDMKEVLSSKRD